MTISDVCIKRPVFTWVLVALPVVLGVVAYGNIGVDLFPNVDFPVCTVTTSLSGASVEEMETTVTKPIEEIVALLPLLQWQHEARMQERVAVGGAMGLYVLAKICEWADRPVLQVLGVVSGHTMKHLLATLAAALITWALSWRIAEAAAR